MSVYGISRVLCRFYFYRLCGMKVTGQENLPEKGPFIILSNHRSMGDPFVLGVLYEQGELHFMAKEELFRNPILGWILRKVGAFPVNRGGSDIQSVKTALQAIKSGDNLLMFPEGTTVHNGIGYADGLPAHAHGGVAMIGVRTGATLVPVFVDGEKKLFHRTRIIFGEPYQPQITGRHGTAEEIQKAADGVLAAAYALGGQAVGGKPL